MDKIFEFLSKYTWKQWLTIVILGIAALLSSLFLTSCGTSARVQGTRKVEKSVIHEQQYEFGKQNTTVLTNRTAYVTVRSRG